MKCLDFWLFVFKNDSCGNYYNGCIEMDDVGLFLGDNIDKEWGVFLLNIKEKKLRVMWEICEIILVT